MSDIQNEKWATIDMNNQFINIKTCSGYSATVMDAEQHSAYYDTDASDLDIGKSVRKALGLSRFVHPIENKELDLYLFNPERYQNWLEFTMKKFGYKTKSKMFKPMLSCGVTLRDSMIYIRPRHQYRLDGWDRTGLTEADNVIIPETCTDEELGAAARLALSRCTSKFIDQDE